MFTKSYIEAGDEAGLQPPQLEADRGDQLLHRRAEVPRAGGEAAPPQLREGLAHGHLQGGVSTSAPKSSIRRFVIMEKAPTRFG